MLNGKFPFSRSQQQRLKYVWAFSYVNEFKRYAKHRDFDSFDSASDLGDKLSLEGAFPDNKV